MAVQELVNFRAKYPDYDDIDDATLATKLAEKFPDAYADLPEKVSTGRPTEEATEISASQPADDAPKEEWEQHYKETLGKESGYTEDPLKSQLYTEAVAPWLHGGSTFALDAPKLAAAAQGDPGMEQAVFPEQTTGLGKLNRFAAETVGYTAGLPAKLALAIGKGATNLGIKALPKIASGTGKLAKFAQGVGKTATRAAQGGAIGLAMKPEGDTSRIDQAKTYAAFSALTPLAIKSIAKTGGFALGGIKAIAKNIGGITDSTLQTIRRLGAERVFEPAKATADYISSNLIPRTRAKIDAAVSNFTPEVQSLLRKSYSVPQEAVDTIKRFGVGTVKAVREKYGDSTDYFHRVIKEGIQSKQSAADVAYQEAIDSMKGSAINATSLMNKMKSNLIKKGWIDLRGNPTTRYKSDMDPVTDKLTTLYLNLLNTTTNKGKRIAGSVISKEDFSTFRDMFGAMLRDKPTDRMVMSLRNSLYSAAEKSGMTGLKKARNLEKRAYQMASKYITKNGELKALGKEKSLDRYFNLSKDQQKQIDELEKYIGTKFVDEMKAVVSGRSLDKLDKFTNEKILSDFVSARDPNKTQFVQDKYMKILGKTFKDEADDLMAHFANSDFNIISTTPGAGGGFNPSQAGLIKKATGSAIKGYLRDVRPKLDTLSNAVSGAGNKLKQTVINER